MKTWTRRYDDEATAVEAARRYSSVDHKRTYMVIESPDASNHEAGRFVVESDSDFIRSWERPVCSFLAGKRVVD